MQTNSPRQQNARRMTAAQKAAVMQERIAAGYAESEAHLADYRAKRDFWDAAYAAGLTPQQLHDLGMELAHGADVADLRASLPSVAVDAAAITQTLQHAAGFRANCAGADLQDSQPTAWREGWLDANDLADFAPIEYFRLEAE